MDIELLLKLNELRDKGILTEEEFELKKKELLNFPFEFEERKMDQEIEMVEEDIQEKDVSMWEYYCSCLCEKYACFKGRARRKEYFGFILWNFIISFVYGFSVGLTFHEHEETMNFFIFLGGIITVLPLVSVTVRRLHDVNLSGAWIFPGFVSAILYYLMESIRVTRHDDSYYVWIFFIGGFSLLSSVSFVAMFIKSNLKKNEYGSVPKGVLN